MSLDQETPHLVNCYYVLPFSQDLFGISYLGLLFMAAITFLKFVLLFCQTNNEMMPRTIEIIPNSVFKKMSAVCFSRPKAKKNNHVLHL